MDSSGRQQAGVKVCRICGEDCSHRPRTRDGAGHYYCNACYDRLRRQQPAATPAARAARADPATTDDNLNAMAELASPGVHHAECDEPVTRCESCGAPLAPRAVFCTNCGFDRNTGRRRSLAEADAATEALSALGGFFAALPGALLFLFRLRNVGMFACAWVVLCIGLMGGAMIISTGSLRLFPVGVAAIFLAEGVIAAFCFEIVQRSAEGHDALPSLPLSMDFEEWWSELMVPLFSFALTCLIATGPAMIYFVMSLFVPSLAELSPDLHWAVLGGLLGLGLFLWPMLMLGLAVGGPGAIVLFGGTVRTLLRTFPAYVCTVLIVYGSAALLGYVGVRLHHAQTSGLLLTAIIIGVRVYAQIAAMRAIGTYYYRFQDRFPW